jgi:hypothetical protein
MSYLKYLQAKRYSTAQKGVSDTPDIVDERLKFDIYTKQFLGQLKLDSKVSPVLSIPLSYNKNRGVFEIIETPSLVTSRLQAYFYTTSPSETTPGYYDLRVDTAHRLYVVDDQALEKINAIYNAIGDAGTNPANNTGATVLSRLYTIQFYTYDMRTAFLNPSNAETFTTTPLGANASYYSPSRDFMISRLSVMGAMGYADQPTATNGVYIQLSNDGTNWDYNGASATLTGAGAVSLAQVVTARYARAVWVNGSTAQTVFRFGGRYMMAGSENPTLSLAQPLEITPVCSVCGRDLTDTSDFFVEGNKVYCAKCYANKRWKEVKDKTEWIKSMKAWLKSAGDNDKARVKEHIPDGAKDEGVIS